MTIRYLWALGVSLFLNLLVLQGISQIWPGDSPEVAAVDLVLEDDGSLMRGETGDALGLSIDGGAGNRPSMGSGNGQQPAASKAGSGDPVGTLNSISKPLNTQKPGSPLTALNTNHPPAGTEKYGNTLEKQSGSAVGKDRAAYGDTQQGTPVETPGPGYATTNANGPLSAGGSESASGGNSQGHGWGNGQDPNGSGGPAGTGGNTSAHGKETERNTQPGGGSGNYTGPLRDYNPPVLIKSVTPVYPEEARRQGWEGRVVLEILIDERGRVKAVQVIESSGYSLLDQAAVNAARRLRYKPAYRAGKPIASRRRHPFRFQLKEE